MDILDIFLKKYSYKFPKGYPDINNNQDLQLLENILKELDIEATVTPPANKKPFENLSPKAQEIGNKLISSLGITKEMIKAGGKNKIVILTDKSRNSIFKKLEDLGYKRDVNVKGSSIGGMVTPDGVEIIVKPLSSQGDKSHGKENESSFNGLINNKIKEHQSPITVIFKSKDKTLKYENVGIAKDASKANTRELQKADSQLLSPSGEVIANISLKKHNAIRWESSKTRDIEGVNIFKSFMEKVGKIGTDNETGKFKNVVLTPVEQKGKYKLYNPETKKILSKVIVANTPNDILDEIIFGKDKPKCIVVKETFEGNFDKYKFENGVLTIDVYALYTDVEDVINTPDEPVFAFSNHIGQPYGIEFRSFSKGLLYNEGGSKGSSTEINFEDLK